MSEERDFVKIVDALWARVQTNEESAREARQILNDCDALLMDPAFEANAFLVSKVKLIMHKAGKPIDLGALAAEFEAQVKLAGTDIDRQICLAETLIHQGKPETALIGLEYVNQEAPPNPEILTLLSLCHRRKKPEDVALSLSLAKEAIKLDMNNGKSWANLAAAYLMHQSPDHVVASKKAFLCALKHGQDKNADVLLNTGTVHELLLDFTAALGYYEMAMRVTEGWKVASERAQALHARIAVACDRAIAVSKLRPSQKAKLLSRLSADNEFIVVELPHLPREAAQVAIALDRKGDVVAFGITAVLRSYIGEGKTVLKIAAPQFAPLGIEGKTVPYHIIPDQNAVQIINGLRPPEVSPIRISSQIA
jgi:tetratricopeptide (TPR) repeat protein